MASIKIALIGLKEKKGDSDLEMGKVYTKRERRRSLVV